MSDVDDAAKIMAANARRHVPAEQLIDAAAPAVEELLRETFPIVPYGLPPQQLMIVSCDVTELAAFVAAYVIGAVRCAIAVEGSNHVS